MRTRHIIILYLAAACGAAVAGTFAARWHNPQRGTTRNRALGPPLSNLPPSL